MAGIEIFFLPVGEGTKSGDALVMQYGQDWSKQIMVVDGGNLASGDNAVAHINRYFNNPSVVEHVVCTHQDGDHSSGLRRIIENFEVRNLWIHQPWLYAAQLVGAFRHNWSANGLYNHLRNDAFPIVASLCDLAEEHGVTLREPFAGLAIGPFHVVAPNKDRFLSLVPQMDQTPQARTVTAADSVAALLKSLKEVVLGKAEKWGIETLGTPAEGATSVTNESSVVLLGSFDGGNRILLTGDAGVGALDDAVACAGAMGLNIVSPDLVQVPHHGSRRNVSPAALDKILGARLYSDTSRRGLAVSSVSENAEGFPRKVVENAFLRRGYTCYSTKGSWLNMTYGLTKREGMGTPVPSPFHDYVED